MHTDGDADMKDRSDETTAALLRKLQSADAPGAESDGDPAAETAEILTETAGTVDGSSQLRIDDGLVKQSLDELLVMLVALRTNDAHGKGIMGDLNRFFGTQLSPGTVYPALHDLEDRDLLEVHELVQTKEYFIDDEAAATSTVREAMEQHLAMGLLFQRMLDEMDGA
jgi:DNA-binding PadR family transcriptional regulator